jgi:P27 family predicted phage terminase small subunit
VVPPLDDFGILSVLDSALLTVHCVAWSRLLECERAISAKGITVPGDKGVERKNQATTAGGGYWDRLRFTIGELGLAPSARSRLHVPTPSNDPEELLAEEILD